WVWGLLIGMLAGAAMAAVHAFFSIHLRADQIVSGMAMNFLAVGITGYFFTTLYKGNDIPSGVSTIPNVAIPGVKDLGFVGAAIGNLSLLVWVAILFVVLAHIVIFKTPIGLRIRA